MAELEVLVHEAEIHPHPQADALEICRIGDYQCVVAMGQFRTGDIVAYIPESSILPDELIADMGLTGKLAGKQANRITPLRLRGIVSQGLIYPMPDAKVGDNLTELLGITKYHPEVPENMRGAVYDATSMTVHYDVENIRKYPDLIREGEDVVITEKIHGTQCQIGYYQGSPIITSKTYGAHGQALWDNDENDLNIYVQAFRANAEALSEVYHILQTHPDGPQDTFYLIGELYGRGIQDLNYGLKSHKLRVFDVYLGNPRTGRHLNYDEMTALLRDRFETVPLVYRGPFSRAIVDQHREGPSLIAAHQREGVVIKPVVEREEMRPGRVIVKAISDKHLLRKGRTTEYE